MERPSGCEEWSVAVGAGSNVGRRREHLRRAVSVLGEPLTDVRCSRVYESEPVDVGGGPFLNLCCVGRTELSPSALLRALQGLERRAGRPDAPREGPRTLDLDLLLYGEETIGEEGLVVPHPRLTERAFVLVPLAEVAGDWKVPGTGATVAELAGRVGTGGVRAAGALELDEDR